MKNATDKEKTKAIVYLIVFLVMLTVIIMPKNNRTTKNINSNNKVIEAESFTSFLEKVKDNYSLNVIINENEEVKKYVYQTDSNIELYEGSLLNDKGYLKKDNVLYVLSNNKLKKVSEPLKIDKEYYFDINFLKQLFQYCTIDNDNKCIIKISDYIKEFNKTYNKDVQYNGNNNIIYTIISHPNRLEIEVDYSSLNTIINSEYDSLIYIMLIYNVNKNSFNKIYDRLEIVK